jgi:hypothetical protein
MSRDPEICQYCYEQPVAFQFQYTCQSCVYPCEGCGLMTPYESGGADDMPQHCDTCWHVAHEKDLVI